MNRLFANGKLPDAIFSPADSIMTNVCSILYRRGITPEKDIRLIGCNNSPSIIRSAPVDFASIDLRSDEIGRLGAEQLLRRIADPHMSRKVKILEPKLIPADEIASVNNIIEEI